MSVLIWVYFVGVVLIWIWNGLVALFEMSSDADRRRIARSLIYSPFWPIRFFIEFLGLMKYAGVDEDIKKVKDAAVSVLPKKPGDWNPPEQPVGREPRKKVGSRWN